MQASKRGDSGTRLRNLMRQFFLVSC
jgi:hypothetical protein